MREPIFIGGVEIRPGERRTINLPTGRLYTHTEMTMPVQVIYGRKPGPRLFVSAAIHGDEINGVEIIRRLLKLRVLEGLRGTLIAIPTVNVYGFIHRSRYLPDRRDLNRFFPGSEEGSLTSRLAKLFMDEIVEHATHGIDLHTGSNHRINLPQIRASLAEPETRRIARAFGAPVIIDARIRDGSLREAVAEKGLPMLLYEAGETLRFNEFAIQAGLRGILAVMREIGLLKKRPPRKKTIDSLVVKSTMWVRAPTSGILHSSLALGAKVEAGEILAVIGDAFGEAREEIRSDVAGIVIGRSNLPLVYMGDALFHLATLDASESLDTAVEAIETGLSEEEFDGEEFI
jgi:predicted deacylase